MNRLSIPVVIAVCSIVGLPRSLMAGDDFDDAKRVVFLGDSITYSGQYVADIEAIWRCTYPERKIEFINVGLPSETLSGLSEKGHAGGRFPRPDVHERLTRVLNKLNPDVIVACYGMNCGIYQPYSDERFDAFRNGQVRLRDAVHRSAARIIHMTPPTFDPLPILARTVAAGEFSDPNGRGTYVGYNEVLDLYSAWLLAQRGRSWIVCDAHGPMNRYLADQRNKDPEFRLASDGVHINDEGHWLMARSLLQHLGIGEDVNQQLSVITAVQSLTSLTTPGSRSFVNLIRKKQRIASDAWLSETGHLRPGTAVGLPLSEAQAEIDEIESEIDQLIEGK